MCVYNPYRLGPFIHGTLAQSSRIEIVERSKLMIFLTSTATF